MKLYTQKGMSNVVCLGASNCYTQPARLEHCLSCCKPVSWFAAPSMSHFLNQTSKVVLDKYKGDLDNLRKEAKHDPAKERELVKEFKVMGQINKDAYHKLRTRMS